MATPGLTTPFRIVIPARHASTRLPGKPLADICGKPMIVRVLERVRAAGAQEVWVATDHEGVRDAVLAAFTDSDFHQGGTDAKGYELKFDYGIADNTWFTLRWLSSDEIDGDSYPDHFGLGRGKLAIDTLQLDLNAKF